MNEELYKKLVAVGVDEEQAREMAKGYVSIEDIAGMTPGDEKGVNVEKLRGALENVKASQETEAKVEELQEENGELRKSLQQAQEMATSASEGADAIVKAIREELDTRSEAQQALLEQNRALSKAMATFGEQFVELAEGLDERLKSQAEKLEAVEEALGEPGMRKSISGTTHTIPAPGDGGDEELGRLDVIRKAMSELHNSSTSPDRRQELSRAVTRLESGASLEETVEEYRIQV